MFDPAPDEPDEWSAEKRWGDPERDLPKVPEAPSTRDTSENEVSADVAATFWGVVFIVNIGLFAVALGPMLVFFNGQWEWGGGLFAFGVLALGHAYSRYRTFKRDQEAKEREGDGDATAVDGGGDADGTDDEGENPVDAIDAADTATSEEAAADGETTEDGGLTESWSSDRAATERKR
ncbi:hypothetical protein ACFO0N_12625 [Halobium salinum]|uniref:DUF7322 domain-containing protein n=1 Tax=Halobium salinum TaxID=1364940 RepID=A0ABD5PDJ7_9EURY|nr:hypothetical protein [Halobium salinum]